MKTVISVIGKDTTGIIAGVSRILADNKANIIDISQTVLDDLFTMMMLVELDQSPVSIKELKQVLKTHAEKEHLQIHVQHEDIFHAMHKL